MSTLERLLISVLAVGVLLLGLDLCWRWHGDTKFKEGHAAAVSERAASDAKQKITDGEQAARDTKERQDKADADAQARLQEKAKYETTIEDLRRTARAGNSGMRAPGTCLPAPTPGQGAGAAGGPGAEAGYVLLPETAESVLDAAAYIRQSVLGRNALIDNYNICRTAANKE